eukprot:scaffold128792_cov51-Prasinocladus_malaysianus.AAC.1
MNNPNTVMVSLEEDETILAMFHAKHGCCHVCIPADDTSHTIVTNKRIMTSEADHTYCCLFVPTGEYTRVSQAYDLKDV